mgnify:CR=1 FL=1
MSRPRKPSALKLVAGTDRADRRNGNEPEPMLLNDLKPPKHLEARSAAVWRELAPMLRRNQVLTEADVIALERVFAQANLRSVMGVAQISGVVLFLAQKHGISIHMHTPSEVKAAVTGSGRAAKAQIGEAVRLLLKLPEVPKPADSADALAIAITHAWRGIPQEQAGGATKAQQAWIAAERASKAKTKR